MRGSRSPFPKLHFSFSTDRALSFIARFQCGPCDPFGAGEPMQRTALKAIIFLGTITTANAQTTTGTDPLGVPTSTLPSSASFSTGKSTTATTGSAPEPAVGSTSGVTAPASRSPQTPLRLPGEGLDTSTQSANTTAAAPSAPSAICPPAFPTTDGGSANITAIDGFSPSGC
jgi:hypothetical protein